MRTIDIQQTYPVISWHICHLLVRLVRLTLRHQVRYLFGIPPSQTSSHSICRTVLFNIMFEDDDLESSSSTDAEYTDTWRSSNKLRELLRNAMQWSEFSRTPNRFVPDGTVDRLINEMAVKTSMRIDKPSAEENELVTWILADAKKTFAIALLAGVNLNEAMRWLKRNNISDKDLPILKRTELWRQSWRLDFYEQQWTFTAPIFSTMRDIHNLEEAHILPFIEKLSAVGEGSFGEVSKYVLHKNHMLPVRETEG